MNAFAEIFIEADHGLFTAELAAARCVHLCCGGPEHADLPIPVEEWAEQELRYGVEYEEIDPDGKLHVLGYSEPGNNRIVLNARHIDDVFRLRFTLAHEIGHHTLNHYAPNAPDVRLNKHLPDGPDHERLEREANRFARALLMPPTLLHRFFNQVTADEGLSDEALLGVLGNDPAGTEFWEQVIVPRTCCAFQVSAPAVLLRFCDLTLSRSHEPILSTFHAERLLDA